MNLMSLQVAIEYMADLLNQETFLAEKGASYLSVEQRKALRVLLDHADYGADRP